MQIFHSFLLLFLQKCYLTANKNSGLTCTFRNNRTFIFFPSAKEKATIRLRIFRWEFKFFLSQAHTKKYLTTHIPLLRWTTELKWISYRTRVAAFYWKRQLSPMAENNGRLYPYGKSLNRLLFAKGKRLRTAKIYLASISALFGVM